MGNVKIIIALPTISLDRINAAMAKAMKLNRSDFIREAIAKACDDILDGTSTVTKVKAKRENTGKVFEASLIGQPPVVKKVVKPSAMQGGKDYVTYEGAELPQALQDLFKAQGKIDAGLNCWLTEREAQNLFDQFGMAIVDWAMWEMFKWSISLDVSKVTNKPGWKTYREKRDHAATIRNIIKRGMEDGRIVNGVPMEDSRCLE